MMKIRLFVSIGLGIAMLAGFPARAENQPALPPPDFPALAASIRGAFDEHLFDPVLIESGQCDAFFRRLDDIAALAVDENSFEREFKTAAALLPFSHVELKRSPVELAQLLTGLDQMRVGPKAVQFSISDGIATLRVRTMMGLDTIDAIEAAYAGIAQQEPRALIVDLRGNSGGAFAIIPLIEHLISTPVDAGWFFGRAWRNQHREPPTVSDALAVQPWTGKSLLEFWQAVTSEPVVRIQFRPRAVTYAGPVFVLIDGQSASATEIAIAALKTAGRVTVIGEPTAGRVLSQLPQDVGQGYKLSLPVGDYISASLGRLEGRGITPDVTCPSREAPKIAIDLATKS